MQSSPTPQFSPVEDVQYLCQEGQIEFVQDIMAGVYSSLDNNGECRDEYRMIWKINGLSVESGPGFQVSGEVGENILEYFEGNPGGYVKGDDNIVVTFDEPGNYIVTLEAFNADLSCEVQSVSKNSGRQSDSLHHSR